MGAGAPDRPGGGGLLIPRAWHWGEEARRLVAAGRALAVLGGGFAVSLFALREGGRERLLTPAEAAQQAPERLAAFVRPRPAPFDRPRLLGVLNVTPDSFSGDGLAGQVEQAVAHGLALVAAGADFVDVGGESTRPGAVPVAPEEERARVLPVIRELVAAGVRVSLDSRRAAVMAAALEAGAVMLNDVSGFTFDPEAARLAATSGAWLVVGHSRGVPATMNRNPRYGDVLAEVMAELDDRLARLEALGADRDRLLVDPGFGFAKKEPHQLELLRELAALHGLGRPLVVGVSRKGITRALEQIRPPQRRLPASLALAFHALARGARLLRVHDVAETRQLVALFEALSAPAAAS